jgi:hypothetical protein
MKTLIDDLEKQEAKPVVVKALVKKLDEIK